MPQVPQQGSDSHLGRGHDSSQPGCQGFSVKEVRSGAFGCFAGIQPGTKPSGTPVESVEAGTEKSDIPEFEGSGRGGGKQSRGNPE